MAAAQQGGAQVRSEVFVGSEIEDYLRVLQVAGEVPLHPWTIRAFSPRELDRLLFAGTDHPWAARYALRPDTAGGLRFDLVRPAARTIYNSAFPYGANDGAVWAGRGLTTAVQAGFSARYGPLSLTVAPIVFRAENDGFPLAPNGLNGRLAYADPLRPRNIDLPQQFGADPYFRVDPGQSTLRADLFGVTAGVSTANQQWGPATDHPFLLGDNAAGFLHAFLGSSAPVNVGLGRLHGRAVWGRLEDSGYSAAAADSTLRFMVGAIGTFMPRGIPGLELGLARFYHLPWPGDGIPLDYVLRPFDAVFKVRLSERNGDEGNDPDNQLASVFARWVFPRSGVEVYGEFGREDHNWDLRDLLLEPDQHSAYMVGFQKVWRQAEGTRYTTLRGEVLNSQVSHLIFVRQQAPLYIHRRHGHTHRGQVLGSPAAYGGAGSFMAVDHYHGAGRWTATWLRAVSDPGIRWQPYELDVTHALGVEGLFFRGRWEVTAGVDYVYQFNRNLGDDARNYNARLGVRAGL